jgi:hypothetical protein
MGTSAATIIKSADEGDVDGVMAQLESAKEILVRRALRIAKRRQQVTATVVLKKILKKVAGDTVVEVVVDDKIVMVYKINRTGSVDGEYFDAICEIAKAKKGRLLSATNYSSFYGFTNKEQGTKFFTESTKQVEKVPQCKGITIEIDKNGIGTELSSPKAPATPVAREKK